MSTELYFVEFRIRQAFRVLKSVGWINLLLITPIGLLFLLEIVERLKSQHNLFLCISYALAVVVTHGQRTDDKFLRKIGVSRFKLYIFEYCLLCLPLTLIFCLISYWGIVILGHLIITLLCLVFLRYSLELSSSSKSWNLTFIPDILFEWKSSIRLYNYKLLSLWLLGVITAINEYAYFIFVFLFLSIISATFKPAEGKELRPVSSKQLHTKLIHNVYLLFIFLTPHILIFLLFNITYWYIILGFVLYLTLYLIYCILYKYGTYSQYRDSPNQVPTAIFMVLCPILPISLPILIYSYLKAKNRIQYA